MKKAYAVVRHEKLDDEQTYLANRLFKKQEDALAWARALYPNMPPQVDYRS